MTCYEKMEDRLNRRLDELRDRLIELTVDLPNDRTDPAFDRGFYAHLTEAETDGVLPELLPAVQDVLTAIRRAEDRLWDVRCEKRGAKEATAEAIPGQIMLLGFGAAAELRRVS